MLAVNHDIPIISEEHWHYLRSKNIGSSDAATLFGHNKFQSDYTMWCVKRGLIAPENCGNVRTIWGNRFELPIAQGLANDNGWEIEKPGYYQHPTVKGMGCTPDFLIKAGTNDDTEDWLLEIKNLEDYEYFNLFTENEANYYMEIQIQHQLACTGLNKGVLGYKLPGSTPLIQHKTRDNEFISLLEQKVTDFWKSITPPSPDGSDSSSYAVKALYLRQMGITEIRDFSDHNHLPVMIDQWEKIKKEKALYNKEVNLLDKKEKEIKNQIMALSEGAQLIYFNGGEINIKTIDVKASDAYSYQKLSYKLKRE